jgi:hypothetical protein
MGVPQELMQKMMQGAGSPGGAAALGGAPPPMPPGAEGGPAGQPPPQSPAAGPMSKPQDKRGLKAAAATNLHIAANMLEEALPAYGSESPEGQKILKILSLIGGLVGKKDNSDLVPAEILQMVKRLPQMGGGTNIQQQIMKQMAQAKQQPAPSA